MSMKTLVILGFKGIGKTYTYDYTKNSDLKVTEIDIENFLWKDEKKEIRNEEFPNNFILDIKNKMDDYEVILLSSDKIIRTLLKEEDIQYVSVYPGKDIKDEFIGRFTRRGINDDFVQSLRDNWDVIINDLENDDYAIKFPLKSKQYLNHILFPIILNVNL